MDDDARCAAGDEACGGLGKRANAALRNIERFRIEVEDVAAWLALIRKEGVPEDLPKASEVDKLSRDYNRAVWQLLDIEGKVADATGIDHGNGGIDLDAARAEIGRRLGQRIAALPEGGVAEEPR
jgi:hypothetical protein